MSSTAPALRVHHLPAVRMEHLAADAGAVVMGEEEIAGRHFLRLARPRHVLAEILHVLRAERRWDERHPDGPGATALAQILREARAGLSDRAKETMAPLLAE